MNLAYLRDYCETDRQREVIEAVITHGSNTKASKHVGATRRCVDKLVQRVKAKAISRGYSPDHSMTHTVPDGFTVKGVSTLYNQDGEVTGQWVKSQQDKERLDELLRESVAAMCEDIKREKPTAPPKHTIDELLNQYTITDYHLGMLSWHEETGEDWDTAIAEDLLVKWFAAAIKSAPDASIGIFAQLGDFLHWDGLDAVTPMNKHVLDADTRFQNIVRAAIRAIRRIIKMLLEKHDTIHVIMAEGNHDPASSIWLRELFTALYEDEPRVKIDDSADVYYCYEHGKTSLFYHHGHKRRPANIDDVFVAKFRDVFGRTEHSYAHMGHMHHVDIKETNLMIVEQHRTLAAKDAYASRGGWLSGRDAKVITYSKTHGEVGRLTISPEMVG